MTNLLHAARQPLNLAVLVAALLGGLFSALWLLPLGLVIYCVVIVLAARDPAMSSVVQNSARIAAVSKITSPTFRAMIDDIDRSQREVERSASQAEPALARLLGNVASQTRELVNQAHELAGKGQAIETYLATINYRQIQDQIDRIDTQIANTTDTYTLQQLQETRKALVDRQSNAQALETYIGRINAQLQNIDANIDNVLAETLRLRTADAVSANSASNQVADRLRDLNADMDAFQKVLDTALSSAT
jgi:DNA repair exonuclease SbcCD ATPase subunit